MNKEFAECVAYCVVVLTNLCRDKESYLKAGILLDNTGEPLRVFRIIKKNEPLVYKEEVDFIKSYCKKRKLKL